MILADITLKGFRNYKDAHIKLEKIHLLLGQMMLVRQI